MQRFGRNTARRQKLCRLIHNETVLKTNTAGDIKRTQK